MFSGVATKKTTKGVHTFLSLGTLCIRKGVLIVVVVDLVVDTSGGGVLVGTLRGSSLLE